MPSTTALITTCNHLYPPSTPLSPPQPPQTHKMVCAKCAKLTPSTTLATPSVTRKSELYHGSSASTSKASTSTSATQGPSGIGKSKLLGKGAKNPYAQYSASCEKCKVKVERGRRFCLKCAYKDNACAMCGKKLTGEKAGAAGAAVVTGQRFSAK